MIFNVSSGARSRTARKALDFGQQSIGNDTLGLGCLSQLLLDEMPVRGQSEG